MRSRQGEDSGKGSPVVLADRRTATALADWWWHGGVLEGSVASAMVAGTATLAGLPLDGPLLLLAFCGTLLVYHLDRTPALSPEDRRNHPARWRWRRRHRKESLLLAAGAFLGGCWALPHLHARTLWIGAAFAVPATAYALPVARGGRRLKEIGPGKPFAVAGAWAVGSVLLPALEAPVAVTEGAPMLMLWAGYRFLYLLPNLLLADAADHDGDATAGLRATRAPARLRLLAVGTLGVVLAGGGGGVIAGKVPLLLTVDLVAPAVLVGVVWTGRSPRRLVRVADCAMLWPVVTAGAGALF